MLATMTYRAPFGERASNPSAVPNIGREALVHPKRPAGHKKPRPKPGFCYFDLRLFQLLADDQPDVSPLSKPSANKGVSLVPVEQVEATFPVTSTLSIANHLVQAAFW